MLDLAVGGIQELIRLQNRMMIEDLDEAGIGNT
jgi:ribonuclease PH